MLQLVSQLVLFDALHCFCILKCTSSGSVMSRNCNLLQQVYNINSYDVVNGGCSLFKSRAYLIYNAEMVDDVLVRVCFLRDTLRSRAATRRSLHPGAAHLQLLDFIIEYLCTS